MRWALERALTVFVRPHGPADHSRVRFTGDRLPLPAGTPLRPSHVDSPAVALSTPPTLPRGARRAIAHLTEADPILGGVIRRVGAFRLTRRTTGSHFDAVC